jgi:hypothetical protein
VLRVNIPQNSFLRTLIFQTVKVKRNLNYTFKYYVSTDNVSFLIACYRLDNHIVTRMSGSRRVFELDIAFIDHFNIQLEITLNYRDIAKFPHFYKSLEHTLTFSSL